MGRKQIVPVLLACVAFAFAGCSTIPRQNEPLLQFTPDAGYRYQNIAHGEGNSDSLTVILTRICS